MTTQATNENEEQIDLDVLEKSANELLAAATSMKKSGFNLDNGTTHDERGTNQGTQPGTGDTGGVDQLQIVGRAKVAKALKESGFSDDMIGKMVAKMFDEEDEDEAKKSAALVNTLIKSALANQPGTPTNVEPILRDLLAGTAEAIGRTDAAHGAFAKSQTGFNELLAKAVKQLGRELRKSTAIMESVAKKAGVDLAAMERAPVAQPKAQMTNGVAAPLAKSNADASAAPRPTGAIEIPDILPRDMLGSTLSYMAIEKGIKVIVGNENTLQKSSHILGGGTCEPDVMAAAVGFLRTHPHEVAKALAYGKL
jgi:hypothetical protein